MSRNVSDVNMPKLSGCCGFRRRALLQRHRGFVLRLRDLGKIARLHGERQLRREPNIIWNWLQRDDPELVLRLAEEGTALRAHADHVEVHAFDLDGLANRIDARAEQAVGRLPPDHGDRPRRLDLGRAHQSPALGVEAGEVDVSACHALNARLIDRFVAVGDPAAGRWSRPSRRRSACCDRPSARRSSGRVMRGLLRTARTRRRCA